jgi:hypothetical protein
VGRAEGAERLSRKQRTARGADYLAGIANDFQAELRAEIVASVGGESKLRSIHKEVLDIVKLCDVGCLYAYRDMEAKGCVEDKTGGLRPIVHDALKLKAFKLQALKAIGLDVPPKPVNIWDAERAKFHFRRARKVMERYCGERMKKHRFAEDANSGSRAAARCCLACRINRPQPPA